MKHSLKKTIQESFFIVFTDTSIVADSILGVDPTYAGLKVEVLQVLYFKKGYYMAEIIEAHKFNKHV